MAGYYIPLVATPQIGDSGGGGGGGGGGMLVANITTDESTGVSSLDKTWQEINDAVSNGTLCVAFETFNYEGDIIKEIGIIRDVSHGTSGYLVSIEGRQYSAADANDYPNNGDGGGGGSS